MRAWLLAAALLLPGCLAPPGTATDPDGDGAASDEGFADLDAFEPRTGLPHLVPATPSPCDPTGARWANRWVEPAPAALEPPHELARRLAAAMGAAAPGSIGPRNETLLPNGVRMVHWNTTAWQLQWQESSHGIGLSYQGPVPSADAGAVLHEAMAAVGHPDPADDPAGGSTDAWARPVLRGRQLMDQSEARLAGPAGPRVKVAAMFTLLDGGEPIEDAMARTIARAHDRCAAKPADPAALRYEPRLGAYDRSLVHRVEVRDPAAACNGPVRSVVVDAATGHVLGYHRWACQETTHVRSLPAPP